MADISATDAARRFSDLLDAVEHDSASFTIVRHGKPVARIEPARFGQGAATKDLLRRHRPDAQWASELAEIRDHLPIQVRR